MELEDLERDYNLLIAFAFILGCCCYCGGLYFAVADKLFNVKKPNIVQENEIQTKNWKPAEIAAVNRSVHAKSFGATNLSRTIRMAKEPNLHIEGEAAHVVFDPLPMNTNRTEALDNSVHAEDIQENDAHNPANDTGGEGAYAPFDEDESGDITVKVQTSNEEKLEIEVADNEGI